MAVARGVDGPASAEASARVPEVDRSRLELAVGTDVAGRGAAVLSADGDEAETSLRADVEPLMLPQSHDLSVGGGDHKTMDAQDRNSMLRKVVARVIKRPQKSTSPSPVMF